MSCSRGRGDTEKAGEGYVRLREDAYGKLAAGVTGDQARQAWTARFGQEAQS